MLIRRVKRVIGERARAVHPDLQPSSYLMLTYLAAEGPLRSSVMSERFGIDKGAISRQVQHLCDLGLLDREPDPADGRATLVSASADAVHRLAAVDRDRRQWLDERLGDWSETDLRDFVTALARYNAALDCLDRSPTDGRGTAIQPLTGYRVRPARPRCSAGSRPPVERPAAERRPRPPAAGTGREPQLQTTVSGPRRSASTVDRGRAARRRRPASANRRRAAAPRGRTTSVDAGSLRCAATVRSAQSAGIGSQVGVPGRAEAVRRVACRATGSAPGSRRGRASPVRNQAGSCRSSGGDVDLLEAELLALVEVRRPGQRQHRQRRGARAGQPDRAAAVPRRVPDHVVVATAPRSARRRPASTAAERAADDVGERRGRPRRQQPGEVEGLLHLVGADVARHRLRGLGPGLGDGHPVAVVRREHPVPAR